MNRCLLPVAHLPQVLLQLAVLLAAALAQLPEVRLLLAILPLAQVDLVLLLEFRLELLAQDQLLETTIVEAMGQLQEKMARLQAHPMQ